MKERKRYQNPDIKVISISENSDIIQTSGENLNALLANMGVSSSNSAQAIVNGSNNISGLFAR